MLGVAIDHNGYDDKNNRDFVRFVENRVVKAKGQRAGLRTERRESRDIRTQDCCQAH
jgi:hypothetical protein